MYGIEPEFRSKPFFLSSLLNRSLVLKHALRPHERDQFTPAPFIATKIIVPFDRQNLDAGGRSLFVGQKGWRGQLLNLCGPSALLERDVEVLLALDELPSLDAFLLREHLARRGFEIAPCYFEISPADVERMQRFVGAQIERLISRAYQGRSSGGETARLVKLLLSNQPDGKLEPLRQTLMLEPDEYKEGIFAWKGFLYYKWVLSTLSTGLSEVRSGLERIRWLGKCSAETAVEIERTRDRLLQGVQKSEMSAVSSLAAYDEAFRALVEEGNSATFKGFLLRAPSMFLRLGESVGAISHIASYWGYRFPAGGGAHVSSHEMLEILRDFEGAFVAREVAAPTGRTHERQPSPA